MTKITTTTTALDRGIWLELFHMFREYFFNRQNLANFASATMPEVSQQYLTALKGEFPCDVSQMRSKRIPNSVHRLRPGKVSITVIEISIFFCEIRNVLKKNTFVQVTFASLPPSGTL